MVSKTDLNGSHENDEHLKKIVNSEKILDGKPEEEVLISKNGEKPEK